MVAVEFCSFQEITVGRFSGVPSGIRVVVFVPQLDDIPAMGAAASNAADEPAVHTQFQRQTVQQQRVALTHRRLVVQRGVGCEFQLVAVVVEIFVVICNIFADIVVNALGLFIRALAIQTQYREEGIDFVVHPLLLFGRCIVRNCKGHGVLINAVSDAMAV